MRKIKYMGPMKKIRYLKIGQFFIGQTYEVEDRIAVLLLREPGFVEPKDRQPEPPKEQKKPKGGE